MKGPVADRTKPTEPERDTGLRSAAPRKADATRDALDFCFEDVSSLRSLGAAPLNDLMAAPGAGPPGEGAASGGGAARGAGQRWNQVVLALLVLTLAAAVGATLLGR
jgi:hypothetical protein